MIHWVSEAADCLLTPAVKLLFPSQEVKEIIRYFIPYNITAITEHGTTWADVYLPREELYRMPAQVKLDFNHPILMILEKTGKRMEKAEGRAGVGHPWLEK